MSGYSLGQRIIDILRGKRNLQIINYLRFKKLWNQKHKMNNATIVLGDSHVSLFSGQNKLHLLNIIDVKGADTINYYDDLLPDFCTLHLGPALAYNLPRYGSSSKIKEKIEFLISKNYFNKNANIICSFGEIDIRVHILKQAEKQGKSLEEICDSVINNYLIFLLWLKEKGYNIFCWNAIPAQKDDADENPFLPRYGDEVTRNKVTEYYNNKLKEVCEKNEIGFISIFDQLIDKNYRTKQEFILDDELHLEWQAMLLAIPQLKALGLMK